MTTNQPPKSTDEIRRSLTIALANGPDLLESVLQRIEKEKLPFFVEISKGDLTNDRGDKIPEGWGLLRDTLSQGELHLNQFITVDPKTMRMKQDAVKMSNTDHEVLIVGDTGTGKEILAKSMIGKRKGLIKAVNCSALPEQLIESELFGHVQGAFTGAMREKVGLMTAAKDGVMFLDEIGDLPMSVQAKLLRALQEKRIRKVGSVSDEEINCKFVCATHKDLEKMVEAGLFRKDLYARISTLVLPIKPLDERECDIEPITMSLKGGPEFFKAYRDDLKSGLLRLPYNVRSLQQYVVRFNVLGRVTLD